MRFLKEAKDRSICPAPIPEVSLDGIELTKRRKALLLMINKKLEELPPLRDETSRLVHEFKALLLACITNKTLIEEKDSRNLMDRAYVIFNEYRFAEDDYLAALGLEILELAVTYQDDVAGIASHYPIADRATAIQGHIDMRKAGLLVLSGRDHFSGCGSIDSRVSSPSGRTNTESNQIKESDSDYRIPQFSDSDDDEPDDGWFVETVDSSNRPD